MTTRKNEKQQRKPGSGRAQEMPEKLKGVDRDALRAFLEKHHGVILDMVDDRKGLVSLGLETDRPLSRQTLTARLQLLRVKTDAGQTMPAMTYASALRVKAGRAGPRSTSAAKKAAAERDGDRVLALNAAARTASHEEAAKLLGLEVGEFRGRLRRLKIRRAEIVKARERIVTCAGCAARALGKAAQPHTCGTK